MDIILISAVEVFSLIAHMDYFHQYLHLHLHYSYVPQLHTDIHPRLRLDVPLNNI